MAVGADAQHDARLNAWAGGAGHRLDFEPRPQMIEFDAGVAGADLQIERHGTFNSEREPRL